MPNLQPAHGQITRVSGCPILATVRPVKTRFLRGPLTVNLATKLSRWPIIQGTQSHQWRCSHRLYVHQWFQVLFHSLTGFFRSFLLLPIVHYRSVSAFVSGGWSPPYSDRISRPALPFVFTDYEMSITGYHSPLSWALSRAFIKSLVIKAWRANPIPLAATSLRNLGWFLFLG